MYLGGTGQSQTKTKSEQRIPEVAPETTHFLTANLSDKHISSLKRNDQVHASTFATGTGSNSGPIINYKTKPCRHYESGKCKLSGLCNFAHGQEELSFYQRAARVDDKSLRTIETLSHQRPETSLQKIEKMEGFLEHFYQRQKQLLEQLKHLSASIKPGSSRNEESISQMETNIIAVYNSAVNYTQEIGRTMDILKHPSKLAEATPTPVLYQEESREASDRFKSENYTEQFQDWDEKQLETVKGQITYILESLKKLHGNTGDFSRLLSAAETALRNNQILEASRQLQLVLYDRNLDPIAQAAHRKVFERAMSLKFN